MIYWAIVSINFLCTCRIVYILYHAYNYQRSSHNSDSIWIHSFPFTRTFACYLFVFEVSIILITKIILWVSVLSVLCSMTVTWTMYRRICNKKTNKFWLSIKLLCFIFWQLASMMAYTDTTVFNDACGCQHVRRSKKLLVATHL